MVAKALARPDVVVVGGGPVGHALAIELGRRGVTCALVERRTEPQRIPKGQNLTQRTMEHFARWGCADALRERRVLPKGYPIGGIVAYENLMSPYWHAPVGREAVGEYFSQTNERLPQYETEAVLRQKVAELGAVTTLYGHEALEVRPSGDAVSVTVAPVESTGDAFTLAASYVVGCDGARSLVREQAGIARHRDELSQRMVLAVLRSKELHDALARFPERTTYRAMHPSLQGYWRFFGRVDVGETWFFHAPVGEHASDADVTRLLHEAAGVPFACELTHLGFWDLRIDVARVYQRGRVFLAGDACHSHPPYGGYGLNTGLEDAVNLGWKLAAVLQGWAGDPLLESYSLERQPVFEETGRDVIAAGIARDRDFLERYSPARDRVEFEDAWATHMAVADTGPHWYEPNYEGSPIVDGPPGGRSGVIGEHRFEARPGHHLAGCPLADGGNAFEALGDGFTLLAFGSPEDARAFEEEARHLGVPLTTVVDRSGGPELRYGARLVLVRPDQHVAWVGSRPIEPGAVLRAAVGGGREAFGHARARHPGRPPR